MNTSPSLHPTHQTDLRRKVATVIWSLRIVAFVYTAWVFWLIVRPLRRTPAFLERLGNHWQRDMSLTATASTWLRRGAWAGLICTVVSILTRPFITYLYTQHLPSESQLWLWNINPSDLLGMLICGVLLMLSYLMAWMSEIAEENKAFV